MKLNHEVFIDIGRLQPSREMLEADISHLKLRLLVAILAGGMGWLAFAIVVLIP